MFAKRLCLLSLLLLMLPLNAGAANESILAFDVVWSPDGEWLAVASDQGAWFFDPDDPAAEPRRYLMDRRVPVIVFDPTGATAALADTTDDEAVVSVIEVKTGETLHTFRPRKNGSDFFGVIYDMQFSDDGRYLVVVNTSVLDI